ncbi:MAG: hypothetical protein AB1921_13500 [Thermodesulfobacteriota bacterium]
MGTDANKKAYRGRGYITKRYPAPKALFDYLWQQTVSLDTPASLGKRSARMRYHGFLAHIYVCQVQSSQEHDSDIFDEFVPIYSRLREREFGRSMDPKRLAELGIIEIKPHSRQRRKSAEYRLTEEIFSRALDIEQMNTKARWRALMHGELAQASMVNLMNGGKIVTKRKHSFKVADTHESGSTPSLVKKAVGALQACPFEPWNAGLMVNDLERRVRRVERELRSGTGRQGSRQPPDKAYQRALGRLRHLRACQKAILDQCPTLLPEKSSNGHPLFQYQAAYSVQVSGRVTEKRGGFQGASQVFKRCLLKAVPDVYNYDLRSAQATVLAQELEACGIPCAWLDDYLANPESKNVYANQLGVTSDVWKECLYALVMGAIVENVYGSISKCLQRYFADERQADDAFTLFIELTKPIAQAVEQWRNYLLNEFDKRYHYHHGGIKHWKNACGMRYKDYGIKSSVDGTSVVRTENNNTIKYDPKNKELLRLKRSLAAFILQGQEACYIHHLTLICIRSGIPVYKNEHDGLITGKLIPQSLMELASERSNLPNCALVLKDLCSEDKLGEWRENLALSSGSKSS